MVSSVMLVETSRLCSRLPANIIAETTRSGGFPPLMINPIDFAELRRNAGATPAGATPSVTFSPR